MEYNYHQRDNCTRNLKCSCNRQLEGKRFSLFSLLFGYHQRQEVPVVFWQRVFQFGVCCTIIGFLGGRGSKPKIEPDLPTYRGTHRRIELPLLRPDLGPLSLELPVYPSPRCQLQVEVFPTMACPPRCFKFAFTFCILQENDSLVERKLLLAYTLYTRLTGA